MNKYNFLLNEKVIIVTGASSGNGLAIANGLHQNNAIVIGIDKDEPSNAKYEEFFKADITDQSKIQKIIDEILIKHKQINGLVNNAGISLNSDEPYKLENFIKTLSVNTYAPIQISFAVAQIMKCNNNGSIVNICSLGSHLAFPNNPSYQASKAALLQLTKSMALDFGSFGIRVNSISPGYIRTKMTEKSYTNKALYQERLKRIILPRWGEPEDLIGPCQFLVSDASSYITGADIAVDGGWRSKGL